MQHQSLEQQREAFKQSKFLAMPVAGTIVWATLGILAPFLNDYYETWAIYIGTGSIFYIGAGLSYLTGENFFTKKPQKNEFDTLFFVGLIMALLVFGIALPIAGIDHKTLPLSIGILAGLMWMPLSWAIEHWVGYFHAISRTLLIVIAWYMFPNHALSAISAVIVVIYIVSIAALIKRYKNVTSNNIF